MGALDNLPPDQRAVLQMVLQRGRSYDEIANCSRSIAPPFASARSTRFDALAPAAVIPGPERALVTDYLLGQLPDKVAEQVYAYLRHPTPIASGHAAMVDAQPARVPFAA